MNPETVIDLAKAELKASRIVRRWPNLVLSKQYQLRAMALYLLYRRCRAAVPLQDRGGK